MLQQASRLLLSRAGLQHGAASCTHLQQQVQGFLSAQQQQQPWTQQMRSESTSSSGAFSAEAAADAAQPSTSGWSWWGASQPAAGQPPADAASDNLAPSAAAVAAAADPSSSGAAAADVAEAVAAAGAAPEAGLSAVSDLTSQADLLVQVSQAAADATIAAAKAECWFGTRKFMDVMFWTHDSLNMPWCEAIIWSNVIVKMLALPVAIFHQRATPAMTAMRADTQKLQELSSRLSKATTAAEYAAQYVGFQEATAEFNAKYKGKKRFVLLGPAFGVLQAAVFISQFSAISTLAAAKLPAMTYEGAFWFSNLTVPDPIMALPIICAAATMLQFNSKRFQDQMMASGGATAGPMQKMLSFMGVLVLFAGYFQPSGIALLWASNSLLSIGQNYLLWSPQVRAKLGLPPMPAPAAASSSGAGQQSFSEMWNKAMGKGPPPPKPAAAVGAPPPGRVAINYVASKPKARRPPRS